MNNISRLFYVLVLFSGVVQAASITINGSNGTNGVSGTNGDPAGDGGDGTGGNPAVATLITGPANTDISNSTITIGGQAGRGGRGGDGIDGGDLDNDADAGNGGNGGAGGAANASSTTNVSTTVFSSASAGARGGNGGDGGTAGRRAGALGRAGVDGVAGDGGAATASAYAVNSGTGGASAGVSAIGGNGGNISPSNRQQPGLFQPYLGPVGSNVAGNGGTATLGTVYAESLGGNSVNVSASVAGGRGGDLIANTGGRLDLLGAGSGSSVSLIDAVDGNTTGDLTLQQIVMGGFAGSVNTLTGYGGIGTGGTAESSLTKVTTSKSLTVNSFARGASGSAISVSGSLPIDISTQSGAGTTAVAHSSATNNGGDATARSEANGGQGAGGISSRPDVLIIGGDGAEAVATAYAESVGGIATAIARQVGGSAGGVTSAVPLGSGQDNRSGNGADSIMFNAVSGSSDVRLSLEQAATAGSAALSTSNAVGQGGNASSILNASNPGGGVIRGLISATGGNSGGTSDRALSSTDGGNAYVESFLTADTEVSLRAVAAGGTGSGGGFGGVSGDGGAAVLGPLFGESLQGGTVRVTGVAIGGAGGGGGASTLGVAGNAASVSLNNIVDGATTGSLILQQNAEGGDGGQSGTRSRADLYGMAGDAFSTLTRSAGTVADLTLEAGAVGGDANQAGPVGSQLRGVAADGGQATAQNIGTGTTGSVLTFARAMGGKGGVASGSIGSGDFASGNGGGALAISDSSISNGQGTSRLSANSTATGGNGGGVFRTVFDPINLTTNGGHGGDASSYATSTESSGSPLRLNNAVSNAFGGKGGDVTTADIAQGGDGGNAFAQAISTLNSTRVPLNSAVRAFAAGGEGGANPGGGIGGRGGDAVAYAKYIGVFDGDVSARARPGNGGQNNVGGNAAATALITNGSGLATAAIDRNNGIVSSATITAVNRSSAPSNSGVLASVSVGMPAPVAAAPVPVTAAPVPVTASILQEPVATGPSALAVAQSDAVAAASSGYTSVSQVVLLPDATTVSQAFAGNSNVASNFNLNGGSDMLALMTIGDLQDGTMTSNAFRHTMRMSFDMAQLSTQQNLMLAFMNPVVFGSGFDSMTFQVSLENQLVVNELFTDTGSALSFFSDNTLDVGAWSGALFGDMDLLFSTTFNILSAGDGFFFDVAAGNSTLGSGVVPVPAALWLFASGFIAIVGVARRRNRIC